LAGIDEIALVKQIVSGDQTAFRIFVEKYQDMVFRTCYGFVKNSDDCDDVCQNVFIQAYRHIDKFKGDSALSTWLYKISVNQSINYLRQHKWQKLIQKVEDVFTFSNQGSFLGVNNRNPQKQMEMNQEEDILNQAINSLPENQKTAFILHKYDDLPQQQIAEIMGISVSAVESLVFRAKTNLQKKLYSYYKNNY
jgi:RNA polymerase sigma-70 factor (ECF subfamily)